MKTEKGNSGPRTLLISGAILAVLGLVFWLALRGSPYFPPISTTGLEPAVASLIQSTLQEVAAAPHSADTWGKLGCVLMHYEFVDAASDALLRAEKFAPTAARWPYLQALLWMNRDPVAALAHLQRATALDENAEAPRLQLAQLLMTQGKNKEAGEEYRKVLQRSPASARALLGLARWHWTEGRREECQQFLLRCLNDPQTARSAHALLAQVQLAQGDPAAAAASARHSSGLPEDAPMPDPFWEEALRWRVDRKARVERASSLLDQERFEEALTAFASIARDYPADDEVPYLSGWTLNRLRRYGEAEAALREQLRRTPNSPKALSQLGVSLLGQNKFEAAVEVLEEGLKIKPTWREMHYNLGYACWQLGRLEIAIGHLHEAQRIDPNHLPTYGALAELYERQGRPAEAYAILRQALVLDPANAQVQTWWRRLKEKYPGMELPPP